MKTVKEMKEDAKKSGYQMIRGSVKDSYLVFHGGRLIFRIKRYSNSKGGCVVEAGEHDNKFKAKNFAEAYGYQIK